MLRFVARGLIARQNDFLVLRPRANAKVMHSEDDQIVPYVAAGPLSAKLLKNVWKSGCKRIGRNPDQPIWGTSAMVTCAWLSSIEPKVS